MRSRAVAAAWAAAFSAVACGERSLSLPAERELEGLYGPSARVALNGNVVEVRAEQPLSHLERGGELWARVGPYIYLFSPQTRDIFERWDGVAAVRVRTFARGPNTRIAEATLLRDTLTSVTWREAHRRVVKARLEGTRNPANLEELVRFGQTYAIYEYNPAYVRE